MDARLRVAAETGDTNELYNCIQDVGDVLSHFDEADFVHNPLHVAAARGHADFAIAIMYLKPSFSRKLNRDVFSPIHLAMQNDHTETVLRLLEADKDLVRVKGKEGYTVFHYAAEKGNLELLAQFLRDCPECIEDVTIQNETALHIAAKYHRYDALEILVRWLERTHFYGKVSRKHLLNSKNKDGNTVLHIAASHTEPYKMIRLLLECDVDRKAPNKEGLTALDVLQGQTGLRTETREMSLNILRATRVFSRLTAIFIPRVKPLHERFRSKITFPEKTAVRLIGPIINMSVESINAFLVPLALILTAIYESILSPPAGLWQGSDQNNTRVGNSAMDVVSFLNFFSSIYLLGLSSTTLAVGLIQLVTDSSMLALIAEVISLFLFVSFYDAWRTIRPTYSNGEKIDVYFITQDPATERAAFLCLTLACMEGGRWLFLISKRLYLNRRMD